jgi:transposase-like protein
MPRGLKKHRRPCGEGFVLPNLIGRAFREVKRRTRPMGVFGNRDSMERILFAVFYHLNSKGQEVPSLLFTQKA